MSYQSLSQADEEGLLQREWLSSRSSSLDDGTVVSYNDKENNKWLGLLKTTILILFLGALVSVGYVTYSYSYSISIGSNRIRSSSSIINGQLILIEDDDGRIEYSTLSDDEKILLFKDFVKGYSKSYSNETEENIRYSKFTETLSVIDSRNMKEKDKGGSAVHGITKYSDMTSDEFSQVFLVAKASLDDDVEDTGVPVNVDPYLGTDEIVSWVDVYTSGVHDQGYCGACWAYSVTQQMQADGVRSGIFTLNTSLSAQQILACDDQSFGCEGGWTERAYQYVQQKGGVALDSDYPYTAYYDFTGVCKDEHAKLYASTDGYYTVNGEQAMIDYVKSTGPLSVCVDATDWASYVKGVVSSCGTDVNHCVQVVAVDTASNNGYWQIRNSWGTEWGEGGYIRLSVGQDMCGITTDPTFSSPYIIDSATRQKIRAKQ